MCVWRPADTRRSLNPSPRRTVSEGMAFANACRNSGLILPSPWTAQARCSIRTRSEDLP
jgi:hypothetical protein